MLITINRHSSSVCFTLYSLLINYYEFNFCEDNNCIVNQSKVCITNNGLYSESTRELVQGISRQSEAKAAASRRASSTSPVDGNRGDNNNGNHSDSSEPARHLAIKSTKRGNSSNKTLTKNTFVLLMEIFIYSIETIFLYHKYYH